MAQVIDISSKITNELPMVKITDDLIVTVNNRHKNVMSMRCMINEMERKEEEKKKEAEASGETYVSEYDEFAFMDKALTILIDAKRVNEIKDLDLPLPEFKIVYNAILSAALGTDYDMDTP